MTGPNKNPRGGKHGALCLGTCGRVTRGSNQHVRDYPNTVTHHTGGRCTACFRKFLGTRTPAPGQTKYVHMPLSEYTPQQRMKVTALFGRDTEIMRMLGMTA